MTKNLKYFFSAFLISLAFFGGLNFLQKNLEGYLLAEISFPVENLAPVKIPETVQKPELDIDAVSALSLQISKKEENILFQKNAKLPLPIASITKLMTALIVFDNPDIYNPSYAIIVSKTAADQGNTQNFGNLKAGDEYTVEELLNLMLIYSSNDAAFALSEVMGADEFVAEMNQKALSLGQTHTKFINPTGLDTSGTDLNFSSASDLSKLAKYILENQPAIFEITAKGHENKSVENGLFDLVLEPGQNFVGGKTGFTQKASGCILYIFQDANKNIYINVILRTKTEESRISEMQNLINWINL
ncbi:MAG: serine hydrolase [Candidatus Pacebacteria bacterium]|nr:serine hydrolase [Candidatus Paceibacterota bacterium]